MENEELYQFLVSDYLGTVRRQNCDVADYTSISKDLVTLSTHIDSVWINSKSVHRTLTESNSIVM